MQHHTSECNRKINILHLRSITGAGGGADTVILNTGSLINKEKFYYHVAYLRRPNDDLTPIKQEAIKSGINISEFPGGRFIDPAQLFKIRKLVLQIGADIVHCNDYKTDVYGIILKILCRNFKLVTTLHGWIAGRGFKKIYIWLDKTILPLFDMVIAVSEQIAETAHKKGAKNIKYLPNAINADKWQPEPSHSNSHPEIKSSVPKVGFIGRISKEKGPLDFVKIAKKIIQSIPECKFIVAGNGPLLNEMQNMVTQSAIRNRFVFLGQLSSADIMALYNSLDVILSPSYTEGLPNTLLEACAMQCPVVATDVGGVSSLIENGVNGFLYQAGDIEGMAKGVINILQDTELSKRFGIEARQKILYNFSSTINIQNMQNAYMELLSTHTSTR